MFRSTKWVFTKSEATHDGHHPIYIEEVGQIDGSKLYAVRQAGACMDKKGNWQIEPIPSSRSDAWLKQFRFATWDAAANAIINHCRGNHAGRFATGVVTTLAEDETDGTPNV